MKLFTTLILAALMPILGIAQFNTITPKLKKMPEIFLKQETKNDTLSQTNLDVDSAAWKLVYEQFLEDKNSNESGTPSPIKLFPPLRNIVVTSPFGIRYHPLEKKMKMHNGVDLKANYEPVYCIADGIVKFAGYGEKEGYYVVIQHGDIESVCCHLSLLNCSKGQVIKAGNCIGISGNTGSSSGPHLHFGIKYVSREVDPMLFLNKEWFNVLI